MLNLNDGLIDQQRLSGRQSPLWAQRVRAAVSGRASVLHAGLKEGKLELQLNKRAAQRGESLLRGLSAAPTVEAVSPKINLMQMMLAAAGRYAAIRFL